MSRLIALNKPYDVLCQFSGDGTRATLADLVPVPGVYPAGRLDRDSEGLVLLTDNGALQAQIASPRTLVAKHYLAQVEGVPQAAALAVLETGVVLNDGPARAVSARTVDPPATLWPRHPPIRVRKAIPDAWIEVVLTEGRNRQVRRMCAAVGLPCLRLIRWRVGGVTLDGLAPGAWRDVAPADLFPGAPRAGRIRG
jgi:23S rRNA pseudouridine2457 synthase